MADPFQDVDAAGADFIKVFANAMDARQASPIMEQIVATYLAKLPITAESLIVEVGAGAGAVSRRIAAHADPAHVIGFEPSEGFVREAKGRGSAHSNLRFEAADGTALPLEDCSVDHLIMHTVLTHVTDPKALIHEAVRVLKPKGHLVVCDSDFSKATLSSFPNDPLDACAREFVTSFVTDPFIVAKLSPMLLEAGMTVTDFDMQSRVVADGEQMLQWVTETTKGMVARGDIGQPLADALVDEYHRRLKAGSLYGYQAFATAIAQKAG
ncbi:MAG: methyltransferase domain-containing protein [Pseudomonadota bacterium]